MTHALHGAGRVARSLGALVALLTLVAGAPIALARWGRSPLPAADSLIDAVRGLLSSPLDDHTLLGLVTVGLWIVWGVFTVAVTTELVVGIRGIWAGRRHPDQAGPVAPVPPLRLAGPLAVLAHRLVASLLLVGATSQPAAPISAASLPAPVVAEAVAPAWDEAPGAAVPAQPPASASFVAQAASTTAGVERTGVHRPGGGDRPEGPVVEVRAGDNAWSLAEEHLGDGMRWREIWDLNRGRAQPDGRAWNDPEDLQPGWQLTVPPTADIGQPVGGDRPEGPVVEVRAGDNAWSLAEEHLGDGMRWREIWDLNRGRAQPDGRAWNDPEDLQPGWQLALPSDGSLAASGVASGDTEVEVRPGDSLWSITQDQLRTARGRDPKRTEISHHWQQTVQANRDRVASGDPSRIYSGETVVVPALPDDGPPVPETQEATPVDEPERPPTPDTRDQPAPTDGPSVETDAPPIPGPSPTTVPTTEASPAPTGPPETSASGVTGDSPAETEEASPSNLPVVAGIAGATVLATGLVLHLIRLRRRRLARGTQTRWRRPATGRTRAVEGAVVAAADVPLVRWAGQELAQLTEQLVPRRLEGAAPVAVEISEEAGIEVLWDRPAPDPPDPWASADGGWAWRLPYNPDAPVPADDRCPPLPALVTVGQRDGRQLMIDLEAFGSLAVTGDPTRVQEFGRAIGLELSTNGDVADAYLSYVDVEPLVEGQLDRATTETAPATLAHLRSTTTAVDEALEQSGSASTFEYRCGHDAPGLETQVALVSTGDPEIATAFIAASPPRRGVAAVILGEAPTAGAHLDISADGGAVLSPLGVAFQAAGIPDTTAAELTDLLEVEGQTDDTSDRSIEVSDDGFASIDSNAHGEQQPEAKVVRTSRPAAEQPAPPSDRISSAAIAPFDQLLHRYHDREAVVDAHLLVRVLGAPRVPERPQLGRRELELTAYLACRQGAVHPSSVLNAIWGGRRVQDKTFWNLVSRTRASLGTFDDGEAVMPPADRSRNTLCLSDRVITDVVLLQAAYERSLAERPDQAIELLRRGLALIEGAPFDAPGYEWAYHDDQHVAEASLLIERAVEHLVDTAIDIDRTDAAREAIVYGLKGLPGNEVLYRARMQLEHDAGNLAAVHATWQELVSYLADLDSEPSESTAELYTELAGARRR